MNRPLHHRLEPKEVEISAEEVLELPLGSKVRIHGEDRRGVHQWTDCIVAGHETRLDSGLSEKVLHKGGVTRDQIQHQDRGRKPVRFHEAGR